MSTSIAQIDVKTVVQIVRSKTNTIENNLQKIVKTLENSSACQTFFKQNKKSARIKTCQQAIAPITEVSAKLANTLGAMQGQSIALS